MCSKHSMTRSYALLIRFVESEQELSVGHFILSSMGDTVEVRVLPGESIDSVLHRWIKAGYKQGFIPMGSPIEDSWPLETRCNDNSPCGCTVLNNRAIDLYITSTKKRFAITQELLVSPISEIVPMSPQEFSRVQVESSEDSAHVTTSKKPSNALLESGGSVVSVASALRECCRIEIRIGTKARSGPTISLCFGWLYFVYSKKYRAYPFQFLDPHSKAPPIYARRPLRSDKITDQLAWSNASQQGTGVRVTGLATSAEVHERQIKSEPGFPAVSHVFLRSNASTRSCISANSRYSRAIVIDPMKIIMEASLV